MWDERLIGLHFTNSAGFERTMMVQSTDLAIPIRNRKASGLEDGLMPVSSEVRNELLMIAKENFSYELFLMLSLGFFTGLRLGSICDLKIKTLLNAVPDPASEVLFRLAVGPGASPPVHTKFGVTGHVLIPGALLEELKLYMYSPRRLIRESRANEKDKQTLFLTRFGNRYAKLGENKSSCLNVELHRFRKALASANRPISAFKFHQTRATFATEVAEIALAIGDPINAVALVQELLLQKDEATALRYIKFVQKSPVKAELGNEFTRIFLGTLEAKLKEGSSHAADS